MKKKYGFNYVPIKDLADLTDCCNYNLDRMLEIMEHNYKKLQKQINNKNLIIFALGVTVFVELNALGAAIKKLKKQIEKLEEEKVVDDFMKGVEDDGDDLR